MLTWLTAVVLVAAAALGVLAAVYASRGRVVDDRLLLMFAVLEITLAVQVVVGLVQALSRSDGFEKPVFLAYLFTLPLVPPFVTFLALKEKTRSSMAVVAGSALVVAVFMARLTQMWSFGG